MSFPGRQLRLAALLLLVYLLGLYIAVRVFGGTEGSLGAIFIGGLFIGWLVIGLWQRYLIGAGTESLYSRMDQALGGELGERGGAGEEISLKTAVGALIARLQEIRVEQQEQRQILDTLFANSKLGLMVVDAEGAVRRFNSRILDQFKVETDENTGPSFAGLIGHFEIVDRWQQARETGEVQHFEGEIPVNQLQVRASVFPYAKETEAFGCLVVVEDVSELRHLETVRKDFVGNVSHELRTPLTSLKALTESLQAGALEDSDRAERFLKLMEAEVDALAELVSELLELARIESRRVPLQLEEVDPCEVIAGSFLRLRTQADKAGIGLMNKCHDRGEMILADASRLEQVLVNLIHNAIKFSPNETEISVGVEDRGKRMEFFVQDQGVGIEREVLPRIFERFYQGDPSRGKTMGTGLGLSISKHLVEAHGGDIWAESKIGEGSKFSFSIPKAAPDSAG